MCVFVVVVGGGGGVVVFNARDVPVGLRKLTEDISTKLRNSPMNGHISGHLDMLLSISLTRYIGFTKKQRDIFIQLTSMKLALM